MHGITQKKPRVLAEVGGSWIHPFLRQFRLLESTSVANHDLRRHLGKAMFDCSKTQSSTNCNSDAPTMKVVLRCGHGDSGSRTRARIHCRRGNSGPTDHGAVQMHCVQDHQTSNENSQTVFREQHSARVSLTTFWNILLTAFKDTVHGIRA